MLAADFRDMLCAFIDAGVEFLLVGAHAVAVHGLPRYTQHLDLWVRPTPENAERVHQALRAFGAPMMHVSREALTNPNTVIQIGVEPLRIDIIAGIEGVSFEEAWANRIEVEKEALKIPVIGKAELIRNKRATGRRQDALDASRLDGFKG